MVRPDIRYKCSGDDSSMKSMCDCPRQSFDFDSLRGAPPLQPRQGLASWDVTDTNVPRFRLPPDGGRLPPLHRGYHVSGGTIHPHRLYIQRGGRLIAAPTIHLLQIPYILRVYPRLRFEKCENMVHYRRGGNLPPATYRIHPVRVNGITTLPLPLGEVAERSEDGEGLR